MIIIYNIKVIWHLSNTSLVFLRFATSPYIFISFLFPRHFFPLSFPNFYSGTMVGGGGGERLLLSDQSRTPYAKFICEPLYKR